MHIVFATLAFNQTKYFVALCKELRKSGIDTSIISFHEDSNSYMEENGIRYFNVFPLATAEMEKASQIDSAFSATMGKYKIECPTILLSHEKTTFDLTDDTKLKLKFIGYFKAVEQIISLLKMETQSQIIVFQELGGFASILATFYVARSKNINHFFMEPSFFRGRMFFVKNSLLAHKPKNTAVSISDEVQNYLLETSTNRRIVIPKKDASHYQHPIFKILNRHNTKRLFQKLFSKYFLRRQEEFSHIGQFVYRHIRMLTNRFRFNRFYNSIPNSKFIYYPFHVPMDVALTIRAPLYLDQHFLIDYIARNIPSDYKLVIKEHPAMIGVISHQKTKDLLHRNGNVVLLNPNINNHEVMGKMDLLITINSKTGAESLMRCKRVICLGDAFYNQSKAVNYVTDINNFYSKVNSTLSQPEPQKATIESFFQNVWNETYPGELYYCDSDNISESAKSVVACSFSNKWSF